MNYAINFFIKMFTLFEIKNYIKDLYYYCNNNVFLKFNYFYICNGFNGT